MGYVTYLERQSVVHVYFSGPPLLIVRAPIGRQIPGTIKILKRRIDAVYMDSEHIGLPRVEVETLSRNDIVLK